MQAHTGFLQDEREQWLERGLTTIMASVELTHALSKRPEGTARLPGFGAFSHGVQESGRRLEARRFQERILREILNQ